VNKATGQVDDHNTDILMKQATLKKVIEACKKVHVCPHCGACNGVVKKVTGLSTLKIVHDPYTGAKAFDKSKEELMMLMAKASAANKDLQSLLTDENKFKQVRNWKVAAPTRRHNMLTNAPPPLPPLQFVNEDLLPTRVLSLFKAIPDRDCELLWLNPLIGRPENLLLTNLLVPPVPIRPSVAMDVGGGSNEDDLTIKLQEIIDVNIALKLALEKGAPHKTILEEWDFLQLQIAQYVNGEMPGLQRPIGQSKQIRGICQRLKGKVRIGLYIIFIHRISSKERRENSKG
jgi:DNA-directed RNA polymerase III subunit RPC1